MSHISALGVPGQKHQYRLLLVDCGVAVRQYTNATA